MTNLRELLPCDSCGRCVRDWRHLVVTRDGKTMLDVTLCRPCETLVSSGMLGALERRKIA